jgi:type II secretory pathway pseudopilin PulG
MKSKYNKQHGFTLVEMAIIVVLAGILLAAGVMAGRGMISRAQTQDVLKIIGDLQGAATSFKQRYGYLPGDWIFVANQLPNVLAAQTGNGDGLINGTLTLTGFAPAAASEIDYAPLDLYAAGLIGKMGTTNLQRIQSQFGGVHMAQASIAQNTSAAYILANPAVKNVIVFFNLPCDVILEVDRAIDDGNDQTGRAQGNVACTAGGSALRYIVPL